MSQHPASLRQHYDRAILTEAEALPDPFDQFDTWFQEALAGEIYEPNAMALATADAAGRPSVRAVLLKDFDRRGFTCAEIVVHPSGRFLYASTRGHDSITTYSIDEMTGRLTFLGTEVTRAATPRHFAIAPGGKFLLAAGQMSNSVTVFSIDTHTGKLTFTGQEVKVPSPVCILFGK